MSGADRSSGEILPVTSQYSGSAVAPLPLAATGFTAVTAAPEVGKPISEAGTIKPCNRSHAATWPAGRGAAMPDAGIADVLNSATTSAAGSAAARATFQLRR